MLVEVAFLEPDFTLSIIMNNSLVLIILLCLLYYSLLDALHNHSMNVHLIPSETACSINVRCEWFVSEGINPTSMTGIDNTKP
jgi:hypothetical protein